MGTPWRPEIMQRSAFSIATNLISCSLRTSKLFPETYFLVLHHSKGIISGDKFFSICDGLLRRHINVTRSKLGKLERAIFSKRITAVKLKTCTEVYFQEIILLDGDKTLKVLAILEFGFL